MNLITVTYNADTHQLVPRVMDARMFDAANNATADIYWSVKDVYESALAVAPQSETLSPWLPIETAPKDGSKILLCSDDGEISVGVYINEFLIESTFVRKAKDGDVYKDVARDVGFWDSSVYPLYWMPLSPAPPKPEQGK